MCLFYHQRSFKSFHNSKIVLALLVFWDHRGAFIYAFIILLACILFMYSWCLRYHLSPKIKESCLAFHCLNIENNKPEALGISMCLVLFQKQSTNNVFGRWSQEILVRGRKIRKDTLPSKLHCGQLEIKTLGNAGRQCRTSTSELSFGGDGIFTYQHSLVIDRGVLLAVH